LIFFSKFLPFYKPSFEDEQGIKCGIKAQRESEFMDFSRANQCFGTNFCMLRNKNKEGIFICLILNMGLEACP